jgi:hypothetical protein
MEDVNVVIFHELEDNLPCQETGLGAAIGTLKESDRSCGGH